MSTTNYTKFQLALARLQDRYQDYLAADQRPELLESDHEALRESCIQRFETCFDTLWKHLRKYLEEEIGLSEVPAGPKPLFRLAAENQLIADAATWLTYTDRRNATNHDYSEVKAQEALEIIPDFMADAIALYETMTQTTWQQHNQ